MVENFDELVSQLRATGIVVDAPFLHGLLTGCATIPEITLDKLLAEIAAEHSLPASSRQMIIDVVGGLSEDLLNKVFAAQFQVDPDSEAQTWIKGYLKAVKIHEVQWQEQNELHLDAAMIIIMFTSMIDGGFRRDLDMQLPSAHDLREDPQLVAKLALMVYHCFHGGQDEDFDLYEDADFDLFDDEFDPHDGGLPPLLSFSAEELNDMHERALFALLVAHEDRLPLEVVHECAARGDAIVPLLQRHLAVDAHWTDDADPFEWWGLLHAVFVLGLIPGEASSQALLEAFHRIHDDTDNDMSDWFSSFWPALCRNKTAYTVGPMRNIAGDAATGWYARNQAVDCVLAAAAESGKAKLETALDWLAAMCGNSSELSEFRVTAGNCLLNHPRERHRQLLQDLVGLQTPETWFHHSYALQEIDLAFDDGDKPDWLRFDNPWQFYDSNEIQRRQARWLEEDNDVAPDLVTPHETGSTGTYVREQAKIGRNDPCPCGSGKKFKKCCLKKLH